MDYYKQIFKRKSFHIFKDTEALTHLKEPCFLILAMTISKKH